jgi:hypothetical protein
VDLVYERSRLRFSEKLENLGNKESKRKEHWRTLGEVVGEAVDEELDDEEDKEESGGGSDQEEQEEQTEVVEVNESNGDTALLAGGWRERFISKKAMAILGNTEQQIISGDPLMKESKEPLWLRQANKLVMQIHIMTRVKH